MAGVARGRGARKRRRRKRMGKIQEVEAEEEEEEEDWSTRRQGWRRRMGTGWKERKGAVREGSGGLHHSLHKVWGLCCRGWRGWRSGGWVGEEEVDGWAPLALWCLICRPSGTRGEYADTKQITTQHTLYWCLTGPGSKGLDYVNSIYGLDMEASVY